jgi:L,D-peptidoglycan transpeptidase YkuD (ErfK/YbiS/YcfS/YnhG family)
MFIVLLNVYAQDATAASEDKILTKYQNNKKVDQLICVNYISNSNAILNMYIKNKKQKNSWNLILTTVVFVGKNGIVKQKEGDLKTPIGTFNITKAFGIKENPGTKLKYIKVTKNLYACDENCKYYNQIIDSKKTKHQCKGEHLIDYSPQYNYGLCIDFNSKNIYPKGSNIFIHVKGKKNYTAGCIAVDEESMITILKNATTKTIVCIY